MSYREDRMNERQFPSEWTESDLIDLINRVIHDYAPNNNITDYKKGEGSFTSNLLRELSTHVIDQKFRNDDVEFRLKSLESVVPESLQEKVRRRVSTNGLVLNTPQMAILIRALTDAKALADNKEYLVEQIFPFTGASSSHLKRRVKEHNKELSKSNYIQDADKVIDLLKDMIKRIEMSKGKSRKLNEQKVTSDDS